MGSMGFSHSSKGRRSLCSPHGNAVQKHHTGPTKLAAAWPSMALHQWGYESRVESWGSDPMAVGYRMSCTTGTEG